MIAQQSGLILKRQYRPLLCVRSNHDDTKWLLAAVLQTGGDLYAQPTGAAITCACADVPRDVSGHGSGERQLTAAQRKTTAHEGEDSSRQLGARLSGFGVHDDPNPSAARDS
jgi:hypothetical protein